MGWLIMPINYDIKSRAQAYSDLLESEPSKQEEFVSRDYILSFLFDGIEGDELEALRFFFGYSVYPQLLYGDKVCVLFEKQVWSTILDSLEHICNRVLPPLLEEIIKIIIRKRLSGSGATSIYNDLQQVQGRLRNNPRLNDFTDRAFQDIYKTLCSRLGFFTFEEQVNLDSVQDDVFNMIDTNRWKGQISTIKDFSSEELEWIFSLAIRSVLIRKLIKLGYQLNSTTGLFEKVKTKPFEPLPGN